MSILAQFITAQPRFRQSTLMAYDDESAVVEIANMIFGWPGSRESLFDIQTLRIEKGERVFIEGPSGSGKSTLLSLLSGVLIPQEGSVSVLNQRFEALNGAQRDRFRGDHIGFIFQMFNLVPYLSVIENVTLPCRFSKRREERALQRSVSLNAEAMRLLSHLNMTDSELLKRPVTELSVGQQQRVAAARALIGTPEILIADEPTSSLDFDLRESFIRLLFEECEKETITLVFVSHDRSLASLFDRTIRLPDVNRTTKHRLSVKKEVR